MWFVTPFTVSRFLDSAFFDETALFFLANFTFECGFFHFGDDVADTDYYAFERDEHFDVLGVKFSDSVDFFEVEGSDLNHHFVVLFFHLLVCAVLSIRISLSKSSIHIHVLVSLSSDQIKQRNNIAREVFQLAVKHTVILINMVTINI